MKKYSHYYKSVEHLTHIDVYRVLNLFKVERAPVAHAVKKLLCAGDRGAKNYVQDITEARDSLNRELEMIAEDEPAATVDVKPTPPKHPFHSEPDEDRRAALLSWAEFTGLVSAAVLNGIAGALSAWQHTAGALKAKDEAAAVILSKVFKRDYKDCLRLWLSTRADLIKDEYRAYMDLLPLPVQASRMPQKAPSIPPCAPPITAYQVYVELAQSQPMRALCEKVRSPKRVPHVPIFDHDIFNYLFRLLRHYLIVNNDTSDVDKLFRRRFGIQADELRVFEDFLKITEHSKFNFADFDDEANLIPK